jgi:orotate phosphoribosyltransferase
MAIHSLKGPGILDAEDKGRLTTALLMGLTCSKHSLTGGARRRYFMNLQRVLSDPVNAKFIVERLVEYVVELKKTTQVDRLAFIDVSARGPSGLMPCQVAVALGSGVPSVTIRPEKRLFASQVVGELRPGHRVLFLCDVLTTGQTLARAYAIASRRQAKPLHALFVFEGASGRANLEAVGIESSSFIVKPEFEANAESKLSDHERTALEESELWNQVDLLPILAGQL